MQFKYIYLPDVAKLQTTFASDAVRKWRQSDLEQGGLQVP